MRDRIRHGLEDERGASLSMALMVFLVCTVVASMVISAASASAGQLSQQKESQKTYYNLTSAAALVWESLSDISGEGVGRGAAEIELTRKCDANYSEDTGLWTTYDPNSWTLFIDGVGFPSTGLTADNATVFEIATYDLFFSRTVPPGTATLRFTDARTVSSSDIDNTVTWDPPTSIAPQTSFLTTLGAATYAPFNIEPTTLPSDSSYNIKTVLVTVKRQASTDSTDSTDNSSNKKGTFTFEFREDGGDAVYTLEAEYNVDDGEPEITDTGMQFTTTITWTPQAVHAGG